MISYYTSLHSLYRPFCAAKCVILCHTLNSRIHLNVPFIPMIPYTDVTASRPAEASCIHNASLDTRQAHATYEGRQINVREEDKQSKFSYVTSHVLCQLSLFTLRTLLTETLIPECATLTLTYFAKQNCLTRK